MKEIIIKESVLMVSFINIGCFVLIERQISLKNKVLQFEDER
jgi:hypothetical protein